MGREPEDDLDRLFGRLEPVEPPPDLVARVLAGTTARAPGRRELVWGLLDLAALLALAVLSVSLGTALAESGGIELARAGLANFELLADAPGDFLLALAETLPWLQVAAVAVDLAIVYALSRVLVAGLTGPDRPTSGVPGR